jgi:UDP-N-acetylglucosamine 2-epimerase (non-hydrolysing)
MGLGAKLECTPGLILTEPLGYLDFLSLTSRARLILTDSGGLQEESTALGIRCITLRENTERPITVTEGTNVLAGTDPEVIVREAARVLERPPGAPAHPPALWDGHTAPRIVEAMLRHVS